MRRFLIVLLFAAPCFGWEISGGLVGTNWVVSGFTPGKVYRAESFDSLVAPVWSHTVVFTAATDSVTLPSTPEIWTYRYIPSGWGINPITESNVWFDARSDWFLTGGESGFFRAWEIIPAESIFKNLCSSFVWSARLLAALIGIFLFRLVTLRSLL